MSVEQSQTVKSLRTYLSKLRGELLAQRRELADANKLFRETQNRIDSVQKEIEKLESTHDGVAVADHAIIRYVERALELDICAIKEELKQKIDPNYKILGDGKFPIGSGLKAVVKDGKVVTIIDSKNQ